MDYKETLLMPKTDFPNARWFTKQGTANSRKMG